MPIGKLHLDDSQKTLIEKIYSGGSYLDKLYNLNIPSSQEEAVNLLQEQGIDIKILDDLGNCWSSRWSTPTSIKGKKSIRTLLQW